MTDLLAPLNDDQRFLIRCIGEPFLKFQQWPIFEYIEAELDKQDLDAHRVLASLPAIGAQYFRYGLVWHSRTFPMPGTPIQLTMAGLWHLAEPLALEICDEFICVLKFLIGRRLSAPLSPFKLNTVRITNRDIAAQFPNMTPAVRTAVAESLRQEAATWSGATGLDANGQWSIDLHRELLRYRGIDTVVDYLERATELLTPRRVEPRLVAPSPLGLVATLDYFNAVWQLHFDRKKPIIRLFGAERTARLVYDVNSAEEFSSQMSCLTDILKNMQISGEGKVPLARLQTSLKSQLPEDSANRVDNAIDSLRHVADVRNALFQHSGTEHRGVSALSQLGIAYPITDWQSAWARIQRRTIDAFNALREEIQQFHEIDSE